MQNHQPPVPVNIPQYVYPEDEISLIDLWLVIVKHKKVFWYVFSVVVLLGLVVALVIPKKYMITSTIGIGQAVQDNKIILLESPETVKAKLENALIPEILKPYEDDEIRLAEFKVSIPKNSDLVLIQTTVNEDKISQFIKLVTEISDAIEQDHDQILMPIRARIKATIVQKELEFKRENDQHFYEPMNKDMESQLKGSELNPKILEDRTIQGYNPKALDNQLENENNQLISLKEEESSLKTKKERLDRLSDLLNYQIAEMKERINRSIKLQQQSGAESKSGEQGLVILMKNNELQQNRTRLAELEEQLYIDLENQYAGLQEELEALKLQIINLNGQLLNIVSTRAVTQPMRSRIPTGTSKKLIVVLAGVLGVMLGLCGLFIAEFRNKVRSQQLEG